MGEPDKKIALHCLTLVEKKITEIRTKMAAMQEINVENFTGYERNILQLCLIIAETKKLMHNLIEEHADYTNYAGEAEKWSWNKNE